MRSSILLGALLALACQVSPVVTPPDDRGSSRYDDCRRASREFCRHVLDASDDEKDECVAKRVFECVAGTPGS